MWSFKLKPVIGQAQGAVPARLQSRVVSCEAGESE